MNMSVCSKMLEKDEHRKVAWLDNSRVRLVRDQNCGNTADISLNMGAALSKVIAYWSSKHMSSVKATISKHGIFKCTNQNPPGKWTYYHVFIGRNTIESHGRLRTYAPKVHFCR